MRKQLISFAQVIKFCKISSSRGCLTPNLTLLFLLRGTRFLNYFRIARFGCVTQCTVTRGNHADDRANPSKHGQWADDERHVAVCLSHSQNLEPVHTKHGIYQNIYQYRERMPFVFNGSNLIIHKELGTKWLMSRKQNSYFQQCFISRKIYWIFSEIT